MLPTRIGLRIGKSQPSFRAVARPLRSGGEDIWHRDSRGSRMLCGRVDRGAFPPLERVQVISMASCLPPDEGCTFTRWSLDDLAAKIVNDAHHQEMSRSTIHRILEAADLKPHRSVYWLNSHDPEFDAKAKEICELYVKAPQMYEHGRLLISTDEKTGMQILERKHPTLPAEPVRTSPPTCGT